MEKYNEIQLTKKKMDLNNRKMKSQPPSPVWGLMWGTVGLECGARGGRVCNCGDRVYNGGGRA